MHRIYTALLFLLGLSLFAHAQYAPMPFLPEQFSDGNGSVLSGGTVCSFAAGTSTPLATYTDSSGSVSNANCVSLNSAGIPTSASGAVVGIFLGPSAYKLQGKNSSGVQVWIYDNIYGPFLLNGYLSLLERAAPSGVALSDLFWADSTAHRLKMNNNNGGADTVVGAATSDTFSNKTIDTASTNTLKVNGNTLTASAGTATVTVPNSSDTLVGRATSDTLTNKTIDTAGPNTIKVNGNTLTASAGSATITVPNSTDTLVGRATTDTLTSKTLTAPVLTSPAINTGITSSGTGLKHVRSGTTCTTAAAVGATCTTAAISLPGTAFPDPAYTLSCTLQGALTNVPVVIDTNKSAGSFTVTIAALTAAAASYAEVDCIAIHD